jgi:hypothetical protein
MKLANNSSDSSDSNGNGNSTRGTNNKKPVVSEIVAAQPPPVLMSPPPAMPSRVVTKRPVVSTDHLPFLSCLQSPSESPQTQPKESSPRGMQTIDLRRALSIQVIDDESWLSSPFIDNVITKFAKCYSNVSYLSTDFASLTTNMSPSDRVTDIRGQVLDYKDVKRPIVFVFTSQNIHWNLLRVIRSPTPEMQLFEPMGMPIKRHGGLSFRNVPRSVIEWLDTCCPLKSGVSWIKIGSTAIIKQQQLTSYDCGVACLLYAEKCGRGEVS